MINDQEVAQLAKEIRIVYDTLLIMPMDKSILRRASESFPTNLRTLVAIHLSSALAVQGFEKLDAFLTHDEQLATAAQSAGFEVIGTG